MHGMTTHAQTRLQQRGIPEAVVSTLLEYGREAHDHKGSTIVYFDKRARRQMKHSVEQQSMRCIESHLDAYAVLSRDGSIVTVGHRTKRINRY